MDMDRKVAFHTLLRVEEDQAYSNIELNHQIAKNKPEHPAFARELVYGVIEHKMYLDYLLEQLLTKSIRKLKKPVLVILRMGLYQMIFMNSVPDHAGVNESVQLAKRYCFQQVGLINAVLRNFQRRRDKLKQPDQEKDTVRRLSVKYSYDPEIVALWLDQYAPEHVESILAAGNEVPPFIIRVNLLRITREELAEQLQGHGYDVSLVDASARLLQVRGSALLSLPEYKEGLFSVQDTASVMAMETLAPSAGDTIVDVCAAPGGKSFTCAEIMGNTGRILSFDKYEKKIAAMKKEAARLGASIVEPEVCDATRPREEFFGTADKVICDVPCSGLGVIRRKPEIKYHKLKDQGREFAELQYSILEASSQYLKKEGFLLYSTCTINSIENRDVVSRFLKKHDSYELVRSRQLLPDEDGTDGFYFCKIRKKY